MRLLFMFLIFMTLALTAYYLWASPAPRGPFTDKEVLKAANRLGIPFDDFTLYDLKIGMDTELEHGLCDPRTNVTNDDLLITAKIAWAHLIANPGAYTIVST